MTPSNTLERIAVLDPIRALATLLVCLCHFSNPLARIGSEDYQAMKFLHQYGKYGVQIFFVVSGFIIPLSLYAGGYTIRHFFKFLKKRALRLHPPFLLALLLSLFIAQASYWARGLENPETIQSFLLSLFYLHVPADNPVFWTLGIEALYYVFIGLAFPLLIRYPRMAFAAMALIAMACDRSVLGLQTLLFSHLLYFLIGTGGFLIWRQIGDKWLTAGVMAALLTYIFTFHELAATLAALFTITMIFHYRGPISTPLVLLGEISYSLYLTHFPFGIKSINLILRHVDPAYDRLILVGTLVLAIAVATVFYRYVEKPFARLSAEIKYTPIIRRVFSVA